LDERLIQASGSLYNHLLFFLCRFRNDQHTVVSLWTSRRSSTRKAQKALPLLPPRQQQTEQHKIFIFSTPSRKPTAFLCQTPVQSEEIPPMILNTRDIQVPDLDN
jgi:hypothetical protein